MTSKSVEKSMISDLLENYPDCPQREMALNLVRRGLVDQAQAWVDALKELQFRGQSELFSSLPKTGTRGN
ncbi:hypothetical protein SAMN05444000_12218 [Shimia gijangensis]|uniref:Uncharacterized protein n=1 Tax=Shimia gijangensis TaxID=1470563 RepID=A0A1M6QJL6_9RHOB|nr:hypothetical protein [Shimia gijangensis]SHK20432.1 hypothetical protein SAMN05444000_12218 [Shimia gijangensis]